MNQHSSFRELRQRVNRLAAVQARPDVADPAARRLLAAAAHLGDLLRQTQPAAPAQLRDPAFLEGVAECAARGSAKTLGVSLLRQTFSPAATPRDVSWIEDQPDPLLSELMPLGLPRMPALHIPRSRSRVQPKPRRQLLRLAAVAAAMLVATSAFITFRGTSRTPELVFLVANEPLSVDQPTVFLRDLINR